MRIIVQEIKKMMQPAYLVLYSIFLVIILFIVIPQQDRFVDLTKAENYPASFTIYDDYSVDVLFHYYLLETYGIEVHPDQLDSIIEQRELLLNQIDAAAKEDPVLQRIGLVFDHELGEFQGLIMDPNRSISEPDQIYEWSCINGQMRLAGTDHPIGFLDRLESVANYLNAGTSYPVLSADLVSAIRNCIGVLLVCIIMSWPAVICFGINESKSNTQSLYVTTRTGRREYQYKLIAGLIPVFLLFLIGTLISGISFVCSGAYSYAPIPVGHALSYLQITLPAFMAEISFGPFYAVILSLLIFIGLAGATIVLHISLKNKHAVSAVAKSLPLILLILVTYIRYISVGLDYGNMKIRFVEFGVIAAIFIISAAMTSVIMVARRRIADY